ncbi:hypothetical protein [Rhodococcus chondri]|uniref:Cell division protein FtsL n=1 Tax=Rhodococcus chondri TaxID=3065941 RepID=A0ABU7JNA0_9NOCA|nr:hypothetical protein [Rhodococcus sp. CC-R104]MEE2031518.1 hypothetical protein [Rhodococcus sp. CC-R104]
MTAQVASPPRRRPARSTAAQRAYERRSQRAAHRDAAPGLRSRTTGTGRVATRIPFVATIIALLGVGMALTLLLTTRAAEDSYELSTARAYNESLVQERAVLQRDVEAGNSAPVLAMQAAELGMIPTDEVARLVVAEDGSVQVVGDPVPAQGAPPAPLNPTGPRADAPVQTPLAGSAGSENPRPLSSVGEEPTPQEAPVPDRRTAAAAPTATPVPGNAADPRPEAEQLVPVTELPQDTGTTAGASENPVSQNESPLEVPAEPEDGRR